MHRTPRLKGVVGVLLHKVGSLRLLEKAGEIPQLDKQIIIKVPGSEGVNVEEFIVNSFKSKNLPLFKRYLIHQTTQRGWTPSRMRWTQWQETRFGNSSHFHPNGSLFKRSGFLR